MPGKDHSFTRRSPTAKEARMPGSLRGEGRQMSGSVSIFVLFNIFRPNECSFKSCSQNGKLGGRQPKDGTRASLLRRYGNLVFPRKHRGAEQSEILSRPLPGVKRGANVSQPGGRGGVATRYIPSAPHGESRVLPGISRRSSLRACHPSSLPRFPGNGNG